MIAYFLADKSPTDVDSLEKIQGLGLGYAFESQPSVAEVIRGPNDGKGVSLSVDPIHAKVGGQQWEPNQSVDGCWIGYPEDVTPESLKRESWKDIPSYTFGGWTVPIARVWVTGELATCTLPKRLDFKNGEFCPGSVVDRYNRLGEIGEQIAEVLLSNEMPDNHFELACEVLSMVYRVGPQEFTRLGPVEYSHQSAFNFLSCVVDIQGWIELTDDQKKTNSESHD